VLLLAAPGAEDQVVGGWVKFEELERVGQVEGGQDGALAGVVWERWAT
jgi:hypothetical protein